MVESFKKRIAAAKSLSNPDDHCSGLNYPSDDFDHQVTEIAHELGLLSVQPTKANGQKWLFEVTKKSGKDILAISHGRSETEDFFRSCYFIVTLFYV
jgi:hypothetical protein